MLTVAGLSKAFGGRQLFDDVSPVPAVEAEITCFRHPAGSSDFSFVGDFKWICRQDAGSTLQPLLQPFTQDLPGAIQP
jgi:hypothetical protein